MILDDSINHAAISGMSTRQLKALCKELRGCILRTVSENGGHLSSNLGVVELTAALHYVFDVPKDKIIWDVGHQCYAHKLLTGRYSGFSSLRTKGGISGFSRRSESECDVFISGHSSTSVSAAYGIATAMKLKGDEGSVAAVIGDGAFTGGLAYEGLNNAGKSDVNLVVVLNDNAMSISKSTGAFAIYLAHIRSTKRYYRAKEHVKTALSSVPLVGKKMEHAIRFAKNLVKDAIYYNSNLFENMGSLYIGPVDGHNLEDLIEALSVAKMTKRPCVVHVFTVKGKGYRPAEENPGEFHAVSKKGKKGPSVTYSEVFGKELERLGKEDERICAITAAMKYATGLNYFRDSCEERFFDSGIAEQHSVTFAAGLAVEGMLPVFAVYSTFLQRSYDQLIHDCAIENTHIVLGIDRAGFTGEDGETHQGIFDIPMLMSIPNTVIYSPASFEELKLCLGKVIYESRGIAAVRYPKGTEYRSDFAAVSLFSYSGKHSNVLAVSYGRISGWLDEAAKDAGCDWLRLVKLLPVPEEAVNASLDYESVVFFVGGAVSGGASEKLCRALLGKGYRGKYSVIGVEGKFVPMASVEEQLLMFGLDKDSMTERLISERRRLS